MSIQKIIDSDNSDQMSIRFSNGERKALEEVINKWGFKDEESFLRFALAVFVKSNDRSVSIKDESGKETSLCPADSLLINS